jgi:hypothetical protein
MLVSVLAPKEACSSAPHAAQETCRFESRSSDSSSSRFRGEDGSVTVSEGKLGKLPSFLYSS